MADKLPLRWYIDQDTTDAFTERPSIRYANGDGPEEMSKRIDAILADAKASGKPLPPVPRA